MGHGVEAGDHQVEAQAPWVKLLPRAKASLSCLLGSLLITIEDINDNAPYFLPEDKTFGKQQPPLHTVPLLHEATFEQPPQTLHGPRGDF